MPAAERLLAALTAIASEAGAAILRLRSPTLAARRKTDGSPVTAADEAAQAIILAGLAQLLPGLPVVAEEGARREAAPGERFALVDPLDGTKEFIGGGDDFTVNIALVHDRRPRLGVVGAPAMGLLWRGVAGGAAERLRLAPGQASERARERIAITVRRAPVAGLTAAVSRSHLDAATEAFLARHAIRERLSAGSAVKFCRVAEGSADLYPRFGTTCEWDVAAGHAVVLAAGGVVTATDGQALSYGHAERDFRVPGFVCWGDPAAAQ
jgi:3'(2'), 5'-bisphosphate nucleotidase